MEKPKTEGMTAAQRSQFRLAMYLCGAASIVLGVAFALLGPTILGEDPEIFRIVGGLTVLLSFPEFWLGYHHGRAPNDEKGSGQVTRMRD